VGKHLARFEPLRIFLHLTSKLALGADNFQWILYWLKPKAGWTPKAFIRSRKAILLRVVRENWRDEEAAAALAMGDLPETFDEWKLAQRGSSSKGGGLPESAS